MSERLASVLAGVDPAAELRLMAYGGTCDDIERIAPPGPPGDDVALVEMGLSPAETACAVTAGERIDVTLP